MMEVNHWDQGVETWKGHCGIRVESPACLDPLRGKQEIDLFFKSDLVERLVASEYKIRSEVPLLWGSNDDIIYEGLIDLAVYDRGLEQWMIIDWKTHRPSKQNLAANLREQYHPQINAYTNSLREIYGHPVKGYLYATALGQLIEIDNK